MDARRLLKEYAERYENRDFLIGDPSWFMHQVSGSDNQEAMAFIASCLSYGSRQQFMKKIQLLLDWSGGEVYEWISSGSFADMFRPGDTRCFYRLYTYSTMCDFLIAYQRLLLKYHSIGDYLRHERVADGFTAIEMICRFFSSQGISVVVPKDTQSACKRVCMFLRWMVRDNSPVDLGLWADFIDKRTLIIPMDTHVMQQAVRLGLIKSKTATMSAARCLTASLSESFPDDPLKGDFALFGYGVMS